MLTSSDIIDDIPSQHFGILFKTRGPATLKAVSLKLVKRKKG